MNKNKNKREKGMRVIFDKHSINDDDYLKESVQWDGKRSVRISAMLFVHGAVCSRSMNNKKAHPMIRSMNTQTHN